MRTKFPYSRAVTTNTGSNGFSGATLIISYKNIFWNVLTRERNDLKRRQAGRRRNDLNHPLPTTSAPR